MEDRQHAVLQLETEIDQHVAATDEVQLREGRVLRHVLPGEDTEIANALLNLVLPLGLHEVEPQSFGRNVVRDAVEIDARPRDADRPLRDVRRENLDRR